MEPTNDSSAMIRMCGYEWVYCNGRCSECVVRKPVTTTNRIKESIYNNSTRGETT
jgi:hypothetical protein